MKVLITGAHFTPAQAVIEELKKDPETKITYIGRKYTLEGDKVFSAESQILPKLGVKFFSLTAGRLRTNFDFLTLVSIIKIPIGFVQAFYLVVNENPRVVVSFGGYISVPVVFAAWLLNKPILIHEQTLVSGLSDKITSFFANKIAVTFDTKYNFPPSKLIISGNPIRREILNPSEQKDQEFLEIYRVAQKKSLPIILIIGGNQGSHILNQIISEILDELTKVAVVLHQTGDSKYKDFEKLGQQKNDLKNRENYFVKKFINAKDLGWIFSKTSLAVARAGVNSLLELSLFAIPTIVVPIPYVRHNEQNINAKYFEKAGLAEVVYQKNLNSKELLFKIHSILKNRESFRKKALNAKTEVIPDAAKILALEIKLLAK